MCTASFTRFVKDAGNKSRMIDEEADLVLQRALDSVWAVTKGRSAVDLSRITHLENSAWDKAFQNEQPFLSSDSIAADETYRRELDLAAYFFWCFSCGGEEKKFSA